MCVYKSFRLCRACTGKLRRREEFRGCNSYDSVMMAVGAPGMTFRIPVVHFYAFSEGDVKSSTQGYEEERVELIMCVEPCRIDDDG